MVAIYNVLNHEMVPGHIFVELDKEAELLEELGIEREQLPKIKVSDPAVEVLKAATIDGYRGKELPELDTIKANCVEDMGNLKGSDSSKGKLKKSDLKKVFFEKEKLAEFEEKFEKGKLKENDYKEIIFAVEEARNKYLTSEGRIVKIVRKSQTMGAFIVYRLIVGGLKE